MSNLFKEMLKLSTLKVEIDKSPLSQDKLAKETKLTEKEKGKYGVLGTNKLLKNEEEEKDER